MTLGEIRLRVTQRVPGVNPQLIAGFIFDRYQAILDALRWSRQSVEVVIQTAAPYTTGTVTMTPGSASVVLAGGTFTAGMTGMQFRVEAESEPYGFAFATATTGTLDRPYDGDASGPGIGYSLTQAIYALPAEVRILGAARLLDRSIPLEKTSKEQLDRSAPQRPVQGTPRLWAPAADDTTDPPVMQIELYPVPDAVHSVVVSYTAEAPALAGSGASLLPWLRPSALVAGATSDALEVAKDYAGADRQQVKYLGYLADMVRTECLNRGPQRIRPSGWMTRQNLQRAMYSLPRTGPRLP